MSTETLSGTGINVFASDARRTARGGTIPADGSRLEYAGSDTLHADAEQAWPVLTGGRAVEVLTPVLLFGKGFPAVHGG